MTLPILFNASRAKQYQTKLQKTNSFIQSLPLYLKSNDVIFDLSSDRYYNIIKPYLLKGGAKFCGLSGSSENIDGCWAHTSMYSNPNVRSYKTYSGKKNDRNLNWALDDGQFLLKNGGLLMIENNPNISPRKLWITVDLDGNSNGPNRIGYDTFTWFYDAEKDQFIPGNENLSPCAKNDNVSSYNGMGCTEKALKESDYFKQLFR